MPYNFFNTIPDVTREQTGCVSGTKNTSKTNMPELPNLTIYGLTSTQVNTPFDVDKENLYLKTACANITNSELKKHVERLYNSLQLVGAKDREIKFEITSLTLQLLHAKNDAQRKPIFIEYSKIASRITPQTSSDELLGIVIGAVAISAAVYSVLPIPVIMPMVLFISGIICAILAGIINIVKNYILGIEIDYQNDDIKRNIRHSLFEIQKAFNDIPEEPMIPELVEQPDSCLISGEIYRNYV